MLSAAWQFKGFSTLIDFAQLKNYINLIYIKKRNIYNYIPFFINSNKLFNRTKLIDF